MCPTAAGPPILAHKVLRTLFMQVERAVRVVVLLVRLHHDRLSSTPAARGLLLELQHKLRTSVQGLKNTMGFNMAALGHLQGIMAEFSAAVLP